MTVVSRAGHRCEYCRVPMEGQIVEFPIDHIWPRTKGGETVLDNLALACPRCHGHKWAFVTGFDAESGLDHPLFNPRIQDWNTHFEWAKEGSLRIQGKTATGRATVQRLKLNADEILTIRRLLADLGIDVAGT